MSATIIDFPSGRSPVRAEIEPSLWDPETLYLCLAGALSAWPASALVEVDGERMLVIGDLAVGQGSCPAGDTLLWVSRWGRDEMHLTVCRRSGRVTLDYGSPGEWLLDLAATAAARQWRRTPPRPGLTHLSAWQRSSARIEGRGRSTPSAAYTDRELAVRVAGALTCDSRQTGQRLWRRHGEFHIEALRHPDNLSVVVERRRKLVFVGSLGFRAISAWKFEHGFREEGNWARDLVDELPPLRQAPGTALRRWARSPETSATRKRRP